mgnify:CR=1 FL=1
MQQAQQRARGFEHHAPPPGFDQRGVAAKLQGVAQALLVVQQHGFASKHRLGPVGWSSSLDWIARSQLWASDMNDEASRAPGYSVLNLKVRHRTDLGRAQLDAWVGIDNLSDRRTVGSVIVNQASGQYFEPGLPRRWMLGMRLVAPF